jgi:hypothetical protein
MPEIIDIGKKLCYYETLSFQEYLCKVYVGNPGIIWYLFPVMIE